MAFRGVVGQPYAFLPLAMSLAALAIVVGHIALFGVDHDPDEGAAAHVFQLLMVAQIPLIVLFAFRWLPKAPRPTVSVLALQASAALVAIAPVFYFNL